MIRSPATPGPTGPPWYRNRARVTCARRLSKATTAAAAARAGLKMSMKSNIKSTSHGGARTRPKIIDQIHDQWCRDNGYKSTSPQAKRRKKKVHKLRDQASLFLSLQARRTWEPGVQAYKLVQGTSNKDKSIFFMLNMKRYLVRGEPHKVMAFLMRW